MFQEPTEEALIQVMRKALQTFQSHPKIFKKMISDAMNQRFLWENSAKSYQKLYFKALSSKALERARFLVIQETDEGLTVPRSLSNFIHPVGGSENSNHQTFTRSKHEHPKNRHHHQRG